MKKPIKQNNCPKCESYDWIYKFEDRSYYYCLKCKYVMYID